MMQHWFQNYVLRSSKDSIPLSQPKKHNQSLTQSGLVDTRESTVQYEQHRMLINEVGIKMLVLMEYWPLALLRRKYSRPIGTTKIGKEEHRIEDRVGIIVKEVLQLSKEVKQM